MTPINLENKTTLNEIIKDQRRQSRLLEDHTNFIIKNNQTLEDLKVEAKFKIKNTVKESESYAREIDRMQVIERVKTNYVSNHKLFKTSLSVSSEVESSPQRAQAHLNQMSSQDSALFSHHEVSAPRNTGKRNESSMMSSHNSAV